MERVSTHLRTLASTLAAGTRLPSTRSLSADLGVGPVTVQRAVALLVAEGLVETRPGTGNFVTGSARRATPRDVAWQAEALGLTRPRVVDTTASGVRAPGADVIPLHWGYPLPELQPEGLVRTALSRAVRHPDALMPAPSSGHPLLRQLLAGELSARTPECDVTADDVLITSGAQSALVAAFRGLASPGDTVVMETPTFWGAIAAATEAGLQIVPVASGPRGLDPEALDRAMRTHGARLVYAQPTWANPTATVWDPTTRSAVLGLLEEHAAFLIEDDWARDLSLGDDHPLPLVCRDPHGHVVYVRSYTKGMSPSIRAAGLVARGPAMQRIRGSRWAADLYVSTVLQLAAAEILGSPGWRRHVGGLGRQLSVRRDALMTAISRHAPSAELTSVPQGGLSLWLRLPEGADPATVAARCLQDGVAISPGDEWFPGEPSGPFVRLGYAAAPTEQFETAARTIGRHLPR